MLVYRVFPYLEGAESGDAGHPLYVHPDQGHNRWDNRDLYRAFYSATTPAAAIGEVFASRSHWRRAMLPFPEVPGSVRTLGWYSLPDDRPLLNLDDAAALHDRALRPTDVVSNNRPHTQNVARRIYSEGRWAGLSWWSKHWPTWTPVVLWDHSGLSVVQLDPLVGHPALLDAARTLRRVPDDDLT